MGRFSPKHFLGIYRTTVTNVWQAHRGAHSEFEELEARQGHLSSARGKIVIYFDCSASMHCIT